MKHLPAHAPGTVSPQPRPHLPREPTRPPSKSSIGHTPALGLPAHSTPRSPGRQGVHGTASGGQLQLRGRNSAEALPSSPSSTTQPLPRALSAPGKAADPESAEDRAGEPAWPCRGAQDTAGSPAATPRTLCYLLGAQPSAPGPALLAEGLISRRPGRLVLRLTELPGPAQSARPSLYRQPCEAARRPKAGLVATRGTRSLWAPATDLPFGPHLSRSP